MATLESAIKELLPQHAALQVALHRVERHLRLGPGRVALKTLMTELEQTFLTHFSLEEELMVLSGYGDFVRHRGEHLQFILDYFILLKLDFRQEGVLDVQSMKAWFLDHMLHYDTPMEEFLAVRSGLPLWADTPNLMKLLNAAQA